MAQFEREERYIVIKRKHLAPYVEDDIRELLSDHGVETIECVVVESDWPEHEIVWGMIEARMTGRPMQPSGEAVVMQFGASLSHGFSCGLAEPELLTALTDAMEALAMCQPQTHHAAQCQQTAMIKARAIIAKAKAAS